LAKRIGYPIQLYRGHENDLPLLAVGEMAYTYNDNNQDKIWIGTARGVNVDISKVSAISPDDIPVATISSNGLMSKEDKAKVDSLSNDIATTLKDGLMSKEDKTKLDGLSNDTATALKDGLMSKEDKTKLDELKPIESSTYDVAVTNIWDGASAPYFQTQIVSGIKSADNPIAFPKYSSDPATALLEYDTWQKISNIVTSDGLITIYCFEEAPTTGLNIQLKVVG